MTYEEAAKIIDEHLLPQALSRFGLNGYAAKRIGGHEGGRNCMYLARKEGAADRMLRVSYKEDRSGEDIWAEAEFTRYLAENGARVAGALPSARGVLAETLDFEGHAFVACAFTRAKGDSIADHGYRYRKGAPLREYFYNTGKTLGSIHKLSKVYAPTHARYDFFAKYTPGYIDEIVPDAYPDVKESLKNLLSELSALPRTRENYGMVHFDFSDGNYNIDYETGEITAFDFDNACKFFYLFDLANLWTHGVGWIRSERDARKRRAYMDELYEETLAGYASETPPPEDARENLPLFTRAVLLENIVDEFEYMRADGEEAIDEAQAYRMRCMLRGLPFMGFFSELYSPDAPFECEEEEP